MGIVDKLFPTPVASLVVVPATTLRRGDTVLVSHLSPIPASMRELVAEQYKTLSKKHGVEFVVFEGATAVVLPSSADDCGERSDDGADSHDALERVIDPEVSKPSGESA